MKAAITGASGPIGHCLCRQLIAESAQVRALIHENKNQLDEMGVEVVYGDILDKNALHRLFKNVDVVYHLAARISIDNKHSGRVFEINVEGTRRVIEVCKEAGVKKLVYFSTFNPPILARRLSKFTKTSCRCLFRADMILWMRGMW